MTSTRSLAGHKPHHHNESRYITFGVVTVSDSCHEGVNEDLSGPTLIELIKDCTSFDGKIVKAACVPDEVDQIQNVLKEMSDELQLNVIITTGGTGFAPRDVTPEATLAVIEKHAPALTTAIAVNSLKHTPFSILSRGICGIRNRTIIINLPGKPKAVTECFEVFSAVLIHAVNVLKTPRADFEITENEVERNLGEVATTKEQDTIISSVETKNVAGRPRESAYPLVTVDQALETILKYAKPVGCVNKTLHNDGLEEILGHVLAEDIHASEPHPPFPASIKDGYAVIASDGIGLRKVVDNSTAGSTPYALTINAGTCTRINTGAPLPLGADAVVQVEDTKLRSHSSGEELEVEILKPATVGQDIRPVGSDIEQGQKVVSKGCVIGVGEVSAAATVGKVNLKVFEKPTVSVLTTGNEIVEPSLSPKPGQIRDSNKAALLSLFKSKGFPVIDGKIASDNPTDVLKRVKHLLSVSDVLIITGGVSMGDKDYVKQVLEKDLKVNIRFGRVFMKPGKPTTFGTLDQNGSRTKLIFGLPGNPVSAVVTAHLFVMPALLAMSGNSKTSPTIIKAQLETSKKLDPRPEYMRAHLQWKNEGSTPTLVPTTSHQISSNVRSLVSFNVLAALPPMSADNNKIEAGSYVDTLIVGQI